MLTYLAKYPQAINENPEMGIEDLALALGKALVWIHGWIEPNLPEVEEPLGQNPQSVFSLGKQFTTAALRIMETRRPMGPPPSMQEVLELQNNHLERIDSKIVGMENTLLQLLKEFDTEIIESRKGVTK